MTEDDGPTAKGERKKQEERDRLGKAHTASGVSGGRLGLMSPAQRKIKEGTTAMSRSLPGTTLRNGLRT
eukprot:2702038-Pyramimonas_sp.AAC.1